MNLTTKLVLKLVNNVNCPKHFRGLHRRTPLPGEGLFIDLRQTMIGHCCAK